MNQWPSWLPLRQNLRELSPYGAPQIPAEAVMNTNENPYAPSPELAQAMQQTVGITVWGAHGPTVVRTEEAPSPVHVTMRHGAVMNLRGTASGRLFARRAGLRAPQAGFI